ncbi:MAG: DUF2225 domain-containing protein [Clostridiales bacterium]|nr:DUF2225 domain-containing protein [Clostridiales bacterium]
MPLWGRKAAEEPAAQQTKQEAPKPAEQPKEAEEKKEPEHTEEEFLLAKTVTCPVCDQVFKSYSVKSGRVRRLPPDFDLRPQSKFIDTNKYEVASCPKCGYTSMNRYWTNMTSGQMKLIREQVSTRYKPSGVVNMSNEVHAYSYDEAIKRYKLSLFCSMIKKAHTSEMAYTYLKIAWLYRGMAEEAEALGDEGKAKAAEARENEATYYEKAYDGMVDAVATENFPICGMDETTINILLASMAYKLEKYDVASKLVSTVLVSRVANSAAKDRAMALKEKIVVKLHKDQPQQ